jgi:hypothetical protein
MTMESMRASPAPKPRRQGRSPRDAGAEDLLMDASGVADKAGFLALAARTLNFPAYFGGNWDAFEECLADRKWKKGTAYRIVVTRTAQLSAADPAVLRAFADIVEDLAMAARREGTDIRVVIEPGQ